MVEKMENDFDFVVKMAKSKNQISKILGCRMIENIQSKLNDEIKNIKLKVDKENYEDDKIKKIIDEKKDAQGQMYLKDIIKIKNDNPNLKNSRYILF